MIIIIIIIIIIINITLYGKIGKNKFIPWLPVTLNIVEGAY